MTKTVLLVYGLRRGERRAYMETLLAETCRTQADVERVKAAASADGWHTFRVAKFTPGEPVNFAATVRPL